MSDKLAIITVIYENYNILNDYFNSLRNQTSNNFHLYIVDLSQKKQSYNYPKNTTLIKGVNKGYAYGVNLGIKKALNEGCKYFCVMNNDVIVKKDFVEKGIKSIKKHPASIVGGKIYYAKGYEYHKDKYQLNDLGKIIWYAGGVVDWKNVLILHQGVDELDKWQYDQFKKTEFVTGCLMLFDKSVIDKIGFWDEKYFLYYEDADFCQRAKQKGVKLYYDPSIIIWHKNAQSTGGSGSSTHQKFQRNNRLRFGLKYAPFKTKLHLLKNCLFKPVI